MGEQQQKFLRCPDALMLPWFASYGRLHACTVAVLLVVSSFSTAKDAWRLTDTRPFAGKAEGVVGAIGVTTKGLTKEQVRSLSRSKILSHDAKLMRTKPMVIEWLIQHGIWQEGQRLGIDAIVVSTDALPRRSRSGRQFGAGNLRFRFQNFPVAVEAQIRIFLQTAMPVLTELYGAPVTSPPNSTRTVTIVLDRALDALDGGVYNAATDEILLPEFIPERGFDWFNLMHQILHSFRGQLLLSFPAWEEGMARAAALIAAVRLRGQGVSELYKFDPKDPIHGDPFWVLPMSDLLNQPPLGNPIFLPPSGFQPMAFWRIAMSAAAWLKVAAEDPQCFRKFNSALISLSDPNAVRGDTITLVDLMRSVVPQVEGMDFRDWYRRQFVLDTGVSVGPKIYAFAVPLHIGILLILNHYRTTQDGDEQPLYGLAQLIYRNDQSDDLFAEEGNEADIVDGEGFIAPQFFNIGGPNLIFIDIFVNNLAMTVPFPYMVRGPEEAENPLWGGVLNVAGGKVTFRFNEIAELKTDVTRGVFAITKGLDLGQLYRLQIRHREEGGSESVEYRNAAFDFYCLIVQGRPSVVPMQITLPPGIHLFSVPLFPMATDEAQALGISPDELLLAHWNPTRKGNFKYEFYPRITTPMMPGVGYWLKLLRETTISVEGTPIPTDVPYQIPLFGGFNQVGNPFAKDLPVGEILVAFGNEPPVDLVTAEQRQWVQRIVWVWSPQLGYQIAQTVRQWQGFWVRSLRPSGVRLVFGMGRRKRHGDTRIWRQGDKKGTLGYIALSPHHPITLSPIWSLRFIVTAPNSPPDTENRIGVVSDGTGLAPTPISKPPMVPNTVWAAFEGLSSDPHSPLPIPIAHDFRPNRSNLRWKFVVHPDLPDNTPVTLRWDGLTEVPKSVRISVTDTTTNERFSLRSRSSYTFVARKGEARRFVVEASQAPTLPLVSITSVQPMRGRGALVQLLLTSPAQVRLEVQSLTGRTVRIVAEQFVSRLPTMTFLWDGRDQNGNPLPLGSYLLRVVARDEFGREQQAVRTVMVR